MTKDDLIDAILKELARIWGSKSTYAEVVSSYKQRIWPWGNLHGDAEQLAWLLAQYGITEDEDARWQFILDDKMVDDGVPPLEELDPHNLDDQELLLFLNDEQAVYTCLKQLLQKYRSNDVEYPG